GVALAQWPRGTTTRHSNGPRTRAVCIGAPVVTRAAARRHGALVRIAWRVQRAWRYDRVRRTSHVAPSSEPVPCPHRRTRRPPRAPARPPTFAAHAGSPRTACAAPAIARG